MLFVVVSQSRSVAVGFQALGVQNFTTATNAYNVAVGMNAGLSITTGVQNTIVGGLALDAETTANNNTAVGYAALSVQNGAAENTALGVAAGANVTTGYANTLIGASAANATVTLTTGFQNTVVGSNARTSVANAENQIVIGYNFSGNGDNKVSIGSNSGYIWNSFTANATWNHVSDERVKKNIQDDTLWIVTGKSYNQ